MRISWQSWAVVLGVFVAGATLYGVVVTPAQDRAKFEAETRAGLAELRQDRDDDRKQAEADRKAAAAQYEALRDRIDSGGKDVQSLKYEVNTVRGKLDLLLERTQRR